MRKNHEMAKPEDPIDAVINNVESGIASGIEKAEEASKGKGINIVIDESTQPNPLFVEIEDDKRYSIGIGERIVRDDGLISIRITASDISNLTR